MPFNNAAWAIDGATINSALARTESRAATGGAEGIINSSDLKVTALATPGQGVRIAAGGGLVLNGYQSPALETYTVLNPSTHTIGASEMPASDPSPRSYIVAVVVGDPEFTPEGHPFMPAGGVPAGEEATFQYVRPVVLTESAFNARSYPAYGLARLDIPANTTTILNSHITDLRELAQPRSWLAQGHASAPANNYLNTIAPGWERWPAQSVLSVRVPAWAKKAKIMGIVEGAKVEAAATAKLQAYVETTSLTAALTDVVEETPGTPRRRTSYNVGGEIDVSSIAGQVFTFSIRGQIAGSGSLGALLADPSTSIMLSVYFEEVPT